MRRLALIAWVVGCQDAAPPPAAPVSAPAPLAAPASEAVALAPDPAAVRARFEARSVIEVPKSLPARWRQLVPKLQGRLVAATHEVRTWVPGPKPVERVSLRFWLHGADAEVDQRLKTVLGAHGLPQVERALDEQPVTTPAERWRLEMRRTKGGEPREFRIDLQWSRRTEALAPALDKRCRAPSAVELPAAAPRWLDPVTNARSTRRRVMASVERSTEGDAVTVLMLYRNGYAFDEAVGHLVKAAGRRGYTRQSGDGPKQVWTHPKARLAWTIDNTDPGLGCRIEGPILRISWSDQRGG